MTCWQIEPGKSGKSTKIRISSQKKNPDTDEYEQDFSAYCYFIGEAHKKAQSLKERDRIKILKCEVTNEYNKEKRQEFNFFKVLDFELATPMGTASAKTSTKKPAVDDGEPDDELPY